MQSVHGVYENGKIFIKRLPSGRLPSASNVIITFTDPDSTQNRASFSVGESGKESEDFESLREFERVPASGEITIIDEKERFTFSLFDYSQGGLCFVSSKGFEIGKNISSGIIDPSNPGDILMELKMEVRGVFEFDDKFKIGCMFLDPVDEDLWHGLLQHLS